MKKLLVIEDEDVILKALRRLLERNHYDVHTASTIEEALEIQPDTFDLVLADLRLPGAEGTAIIPHAAAVPVIIMTSHASVRSAVDAMRCGAIDYIAKPFDHGELLMVIDRALKQNQLKAQNQALKYEIQRPSRYPQLAVIPMLLANDPSFAAHEKCPEFLHLHGEAGTECEAMAQWFHNRDPDWASSAPYVVADLHPASVEKQRALLFGTAKRETTKNTIPGGLVALALNGTLVLRHPEHLNEAVQHELGEFFHRTHPSAIKGRFASRPKINVISISNSSITELEKKGKLTPELAELFAQQELQLDPLRQHTDHIMRIAEAQLQLLAKNQGRKPMKFSVEAIAAIRAYDWPGNAAELHHLLARAIYLARTNTLYAEHLGFSVQVADERDLSLDEYFRYVVLRNQATLSETELASRLGISRKALWERRQKMQLPRDSSPEKTNNPSI